MKNIEEFKKEIIDRYQDRVESIPYYWGWEDDVNDFETLIEQFIEVMNNKRLDT